MPPAASASSLVAATALLLGAIAPARPAGEAAERQEVWRACLSRNFAVAGVLADRERAADSAFHACRGAEDAYIAALAASPLLDEDDVARARPGLAGRIRAWLVRGGD